MSDARRLPVYILLDVSGSMAGEPIEAVRQGMKALIQDLKGDAQAIESAHLSVITFGSSATQVSPLTEIGSFQEPLLNAAGDTKMGAALALLEQCLENEVRRASSTQKGDWRPLVFLMTDGQPTDSWEDAADRIKQKKTGNIIACGAGSGVDTTCLKRITENVVVLNNLQPEGLRAYFKWVSGSIKATSDKVAQVTGDAPMNLPPPPPVITIVP